MADNCPRPEGGSKTLSQSIVQPLRRWDPERIGPYSIIGKLGAGAMGQVFLARSTTGRLVAVKTIRIELAEEPGYRARFAREVSAASRVSGVFTASVIQADAEADLPWVATAYVPAPSLSTLVRRCGPLPVPAVRWLAAGCAEALQSIHGVGLLHRDVKPSNVLVAPDGPQVIDFGVARAAERIQLTATRGAAGTPAYMAPEQARDATLASSASDMFSLGATLVFAATGHPPYQGETVMDILVRLATEPPDLTGLPEELTELVAACLERVPRDRPTDAAILKELGSFALPAGPGHSYLPDSAMVLIAEYQHNLRLPAARAVSDYADDAPPDGETTGSGSSVSSDPTSGSHTALPGFESPAVLHPGDGPPLHPGDGPPRRGRRRKAPRLGAGPRSVARSRSLVWMGVAAGAAALVAAGIGLGMVLHGSGAQAAATGTNTDTNTTSASASAGSGSPYGQPPALPSAALACTTPRLTSTPELCLSQPFGDGDTVFVLHGNGFLAFKRVTVKIVGVGVSRDRPLADLQGTFNYAIDQGHEFFPGSIPAGSYKVVVTGSGGRSATTSFRVSDADSGQPPPPPGTP
jgi:serine/threonine protein kinase